MDGGKLSEVNARTESRRQNKLVGKFKISDLVSVRGQVMEYMYIPTGIERELVRFGMDCDHKRCCRDCWMRTGGHSFYRTDCL